MTEPKTASPLAYQERDFALLKGLFESRVMTLDHMATLYFDERKEAAKKRVQKLKAAGLIAERPRRVNEPSVHFLTASGLKLLSEQGHLAGYPKFSASALEKRAQVSAITLRHELDIMDVKAALCSAIAKTANFKVAEFSTWPALYEFTARRPAASGTASFNVRVKPDGFIRIHEQEPDGGLSEHTFFLEVDRSTETLDTLALKAACYNDYYRRGGLSVRNGQPASAYKDFPFRVLMVCKTEERRDNAAARMLKSNPPILTQVWLTTTEELLADTLRTVWVRPCDCARDSTSRFSRLLE